MLIGLTGRAQAGKDTVCERLALLDRVRRLSFADKLYEAAGRSIGVHPDTLRVLKTMPDALLTLEAPLPEGDPRGPGQAVVNQISVRHYLQLFGTEGHRSVFGDDFWVDAAFAGADLAEGHTVITDVRFPNEAAKIRELGGVIAHVIGPAEVEDVGDAHVSEAGLPAEAIDWEILNDIRDDGFESLDRRLNDLLLWVAVKELD